MFRRSVDLLRVWEDSVIDQAQGLIDVLDKESKALNRFVLFWIFRDLGQHALRRSNGFARSNRNDK